MGDSGTPSAFTKPDIGRGWLHALTIYRIEHGHTRRELTTGDDVYVITTHDAEHCTICQHLVGPLFHAWDWVEPCTCEYALHQTDFYPTHRIDVPGVGMRGAAYTFRINPWCPHHGAEDEFGRMPAAELVLDEDERRGH